MFFCQQSYLSARLVSQVAVCAARGAYGRRYQAHRRSHLHIAGCPRDLGGGDGTGDYEGKSEEAGDELHDKTFLVHLLEYL